MLELFLSKMEVKACNCLTQEEKKLILANYEEGKSYSEIAGIVWRSKRVVYCVISRFKAKTFEPKPRIGRLPMTIKWEDQMIVKMSLKDRFNTATFISCAFCEQTGKPIFRKTVSCRLNKEKVVAQIPCHKPLISKKNQKVCLDFTTEHILWTEKQWNIVHFSDKSKFNFLGSDGKRFVRRENKECLSPQYVKKTMKFGGWSVMVWGMISSVGVGPIVHFHGNINASVYKELLRQHALPHLHKGTVETPIFMQDNMPCHKAKTVLSFLEEEGIAVVK